MGRNNDRDRGRRAVKETRPTRGKPKICIFCAGKVEWIDYKDTNTLRRFTSDRGKIRARRVSGNCSQHQRDVAIAVKTARELALLPYSQRTVTERGPGRGPRGDRDRDRAPRLVESDAHVGEDVAGDVDLGDEVEKVEEADRVLSEVGR